MVLHRPPHIAEYAFDSSRNHQNDGHSLDTCTVWCPDDGKRGLCVDPIIVKREEKKQKKFLYEFLNDIDEFIILYTSIALENGSC